MKGLHLTFVALALLAGRSAADQIVVPGGSATQEGDANNTIPFGVGDPSLTMRYQQVYGASAFPGGPWRITQSAFRTDGTFGHPFTSAAPLVQINLSTTMRGPGNLPNVFAENVGPDELTVFSGPLPLSSAGTGDFDIIIALTQPFLYDPSRGNLLLDVRHHGSSANIALDAVSSTDDAVSRAYTWGDLRVGATSGYTDSIGLVTRFEAERVVNAPEPAGLALFGAGALTAVGALGLKRRPGVRGTRSRQPRRAP
jgi:hypothetical protein